MGLEIDDQRWSRLLDEFHRQLDAEQADDEARRYASRIGRRVSIVVVFLVVTAVVALFVAVALWQAVREDASRCPPRAGQRAEVVIGGWAENDECAYYARDGSGERIGGDLAGPVTRTYEDALADNALRIVIAGLVLVTAGAGAVIWERRIAARRASARPPS